MQIDAGADAIQIFDSWAALCDDSNYWDISLKWIKQIIDSLPDDFPIILYAKGMAEHMELLLKTGARVISLDWTVKLDEVRRNNPGNYSLQGNLDPDVMNRNTEDVVAAATEILDNTRDDHAHIFNLGHGIMPTAKVENMEALVETVQNYSLT